MSHIRTCTNRDQFVRCDPWPAKEEKESASGERRQLFKFRHICSGRIRLLLRS